MPLKYDATNRTFHNRLRQNKLTKKEKDEPSNKPRKYTGILTEFSPPGHLGDDITYELILGGYRVHASIEVQLDIAHRAITMVGGDATAAYEKAEAAGKEFIPGVRVVVTLHNCRGSTQNPTIATLELAEGFDGLQTGAAQLM